MKSMQFLWLAVVSNVVSVVVTTVAVIHLWNGGKDSIAPDSIAISRGGTSTRSINKSHRGVLAQECCACSGPTPAPFNGVASSSLACPSGEGSSSFSTTGAVEFGISDAKRLCTLVRISPDGTSFKPIGRSYDGNSWESSAGEFSTMYWSCSGSSCVANLPALPVGSVYQLTSFDNPQHFLGQIDEIARFLEQTTFGPTRAAINTFDASDLPAAFAKWVFNQQTTVPITSHRAIFRQHLNARMEVATPQGAVTHPCQAGTRYRRFSFSLKDDEKYLDITTVGTKRVLRVDGFVRTVVEGPIVSIWDPTVVFQDGSYPIGRTFQGNTRLYDAFNLLHSSQSTDHAISFNGVHGNPPVEFDLSISAEPNVLLELSNSNARSIDAEYFQGDSIRVQELILTTDLSSADCASLEEPGNPVNPVFALFGGNYFIHDPRFETINNTVESPAPDGGGKAQRVTANIIQPALAATCSNVQRTFLNEESCVLSYDTAACTSPKGYEWEDDGSELPDFYVSVTPETIRNIYTETGGGAEGTRYLYSIEGLRVEEDFDIDPPCQKFTSSRWVKIGCTGAATTLDETVHDIFSTLMLYSDDDNDVVRDLWNWHDSDCPSSVFSLRGFEIVSEGTCWRNVHPDHMNVYDFTYWTRLDSHPGNSQARNPIKGFAQAGQTVLTFPSWHEMNRWSSNKYSFGYVGRLGDPVHYYDLPDELRSQQLSDYFGFTPSAIQYTDSAGVMVCGSPYEVANNPSLGGSQSRGAFDSLNWDSYTTSEEDFEKQKRIIWTLAALTADDQLRQRVAWALAQILVISPDAIQDGIYSTEAMLTYYDIFVRNAFGNYRDILKEVSYSPMMADMLTYYGSQSTQWIWYISDNIEYADENFAREVMQLFSTGLYQLNLDGSQVVGPNGGPVRVYTNDDIVEYARVWTGFEARRERGNVESLYLNQIDPMRIIMDHRDVFPKMGMDRRYVGDGVPLCADLPSNHFLMKGATYRLLGPRSSPELVEDPEEWEAESIAQRFKLQPAGSNSLFTKLCGSQNPSNCKNKAKVILDDTIPCNGSECFVDTVRVVEVGSGIFYEYVRPPCVFQAFFENPKLVVQRVDWWDLTCADPRTQVASSACCDTTGNMREWNDQYWGERTTFATAEQRCTDAELCSRSSRPSCDVDDSTVGAYCAGNDQFWTSTTCTLRAKIDNHGNVAIVHRPNDGGIEDEAISHMVQAENAKTFFRVDWFGDASSVTSNCASVETCIVTLDGMCVCDVYVVNEQVFSNGQIPTRDSVLDSLHIGAFDPVTTNLGLSPTTIGDVTRYTKNGVLTADSIFEVTDDNGIRQLLKNERSTVHLTGRSISFRNAVHFISLSDPEVRDAEQETDAALDHYFYHSNTAPFLAIRFAQRFGVSNPSPRYIERIATSFRTGSYSINGVNYGSNTYGDLAAMVACVLLDREARDTVLDADPSHGSMKEPLIKLMGLMRGLEFDLYDNFDFVDLDIDFGLKIGQMAHAIPSVFSFFLPEYSPSGPVSLASLVAPEAQVLTGPRLLDMLNGVLSLIRYGLSACHGGLARDTWWEDIDCDSFSAGAINEGSLGRLTYSPSDSSSAETITDELAALLTGGRLSLASREIIDEVINAETNPTLAMIKAQQLIALSPEFHSTNMARKTGASRPEPRTPPASTKPYKAVVYVLLDGGVDSFNMLAPHSCTATNADGQTLLQQYYAERTSIAISETERSRIVDAIAQPCSQFVVHQDLEVVERLYKEGDLAFFANTGVINKPVNKNNYYEETTTQLFAHNAMQEEAQKVDPFDGAPGTGILGRMCDILNGKGFNAQPITVEDATIATVGVPGTAVDPISVSPYGSTAFYPSVEGENFDPRPFLDRLNDSVELQSSLYGETYSKRLQKALFDNEALVEALATTQLNQSFQDTEYSSKLKSVATLIASHNQRGTDRDVFYVSLGGWDNHQNLKTDLALNFRELNSALDSFSGEMKSQGYWDNVSLVITSDFGRTLTANSGEGSDHAWGGNYFVMGGAVKGGRIHGEYPPDITQAGPYNIGRGRLIPTLSWESMLNSVVEWMGAETTEELDYCLPNRDQTGTKLFSKDEVFESSSRSFWK